MIDKEIIQVIIQGGNVGISIALIILLWKIIELLGNHLTDLGKLIGDLRKEISDLRGDIKDWRLFNNKKK